MKPTIFQRPTYFHALIALLLFGAGTAILASTSTAMQSLVTTAKLDVSNMKLFAEVSRLAEAGNPSAKAARDEWVASQVQIRQESKHINAHTRVVVTGFGALGLTMVATLLTLLPIRRKESAAPAITQA